MFEVLWPLDDWDGDEAYCRKACRQVLRNLSAYLTTQEPALDLHTLEEAAKRIERHFGHLAWSQTIADSVRDLAQKGEAK